MHKIVHLDLKGAPLKVPFLEKVLKNIKKWGGTGILLEWEDSFPYSGDLVEIGSTNDASGDGMYSHEEVKNIFQLAKDNELEVIQLIQTIGHLEFVLKHPNFKDLQEKPNFPAVLCPSNSKSQALVRTMVKQALDAQPDANYFHIGADEVWHSAICPDCEAKASSNEHGKICLFLEHIRDLARFIKNERPNLTILMWDDMLRQVDIDTFIVYSLGELVQPVIWDYNIEEYFCIDLRSWRNYSAVFPKVWAGSAFKGANGSCQINPDCNRYISNQNAWINAIKSNNNENDFDGVILTGWSRYDHYATLCELLSVSMECLRLCLKTWEYQDETDDSGYDPNNVECYNMMHNVECYNNVKGRCLKLLHSDIVATWMNPWQIDHGYTCSAQLEVVLNEASMLYNELLHLQTICSTTLLSVTGKRSTEEWVGTFITPLLKQIENLRDQSSKCINKVASWNQLSEAVVDMLLTDRLMTKEINVIKVRYAFLGTELLNALQERYEICDQARRTDGGHNLNIYKTVIDIIVWSKAYSMF